LSDIKAFVFGASTSRFWCLRKHLISQDDIATVAREGDIPFYYWECITLQLENKDIYLIIRNEQRMKDFIKLLIYELKTIDG